MLSLRKNFSDSQEVKTEMIEAETKIQAMALVHKKLYHSNDLSNISLREYVSDLVHLLVGSYSVQDTIEVNTSIDEINIIIDIAIPIGLIINEMLYNAFKYAFPDNRGRIDIEIRGSAETFSIHIKDNGIGVPPEFDFQHIKTYLLNYRDIKDLDGSKKLLTAPRLENPYALHWKF